MLIVVSSALYTAGRAHLRHLWRILRKKTVRGSEQLFLRLGKTLPTGTEDLTEQARVPLL